VYLQINFANTGIVVWSSMLSSFHFSPTPYLLPAAVWSSMLSSFSFAPTPYLLPAAQCGTQDSQGRTIMPALVPVTAERLEPHGLFLLENGFVCDRLR
jgi:hypothetical protein